ncbi:MAG: hypothetical protein ACTHK7_00190 [Aureliella sp.]
MSVFTKEDDWFEGALSVEVPERPSTIANQWSDDDSSEEPDLDEDGVELPLDDDQAEEDPFGDFDDDDFDDEFDDDFEEELEDDYEIEPDDSEMFPEESEDDEFGDEELDDIEP